MRPVRFSVAITLLALGGLGLSACEPSASVETGPARASVTCDASFYTYLIGEPITVVDSLNTGLRVRVLAADAFVTKDYDANRLTFTATTDDTVSRVFCG